MSNDDPAKKLDDLLDGYTIVMLMTMIGDDHSSRPLTVAETSGDRLSFLVDRTVPWAAAIADGSATVHATVADGKANTYLSLNGAASITADRAEVDRLWSAAAGAFFDGKDDPAVGVLRFDVADGEYWDGPSGKLGAAIAVVRAALTDDPDKAGAHGDVATTA
jgi:general stress protein 26